MQADVIKIGNYKAIRLPAAILKQCGIGSRVELEVRHNHIVIKPVRAARQGWLAAFKRMSQNGDDQILIPDELDADLLKEWHEID